MKDTAMTSSDLMVEAQAQAQQPQPIQCVLPNAEVRRFLLDVLQQASFPGRISEYVSDVKQLLSNATLIQPNA